MQADEKAKLIERVASALGALAEYGFASPVVSERGQMSTLSVSTDVIALEVELDWRERSAFLLIVRLENGEFPNGYYVADGKPCRYHLVKVIEDQKFNVDPELILRARQDAQGQTQIRSNSSERMQDQIAALMKVLEACIGQLLQAQREIFMLDT